MTQDTNNVPSQQQPLGEPASSSKGEDKLASIPESEIEFVKKWAARIVKAKAHWQPDFDRMRANMAFTSGKQWEGQTEITDERYVCNITIQAVRNKVANLYARNPEVEITPRERRNYQLWSGDVEDLIPAFQAVQMGRAQGVPNIPAEALMMDFMHGKQLEQMVQNICDTLKKTYDYQVDVCRPEFKEQMKQAVNRAVVTGVGYCRPHFVSQGDSPISTVETRHSIVDRAKLAKTVQEKILDDDGSPESEAAVEELQSLVNSIGYSTQSGDEYELPEKIEFDFPPSTSIIPDTRCRSLKEFVAARWIVQEYCLPLEEVNTVFQTDIEEADLSPYRKDSEEKAAGASYERPDFLDETEKPMEHATVWEVMDYTTKQVFFLLRGYPGFLKAPESPDPCVAGFWPVQALTFNDVEAEEDSETSIFPPSDVDLVLHPQKEWNRTREALRDQRNANAPKYPIRDGVLTDEDLDKIENAEPNSVIRLKGIPADVPPDTFIKPMQVAKIDPQVYDTGPLEQDMQLGGGFQQANIGPAQPDVTATVGTIAEQSRQTVTASNVDDLDGFLSRVSKNVVEMVVRRFTPQTVETIVGPGTVFPTQDQSNWLNMVNCQIKAASSGRPNRAMEVSNAQQIVPLMLQAGGNPIAIIEYLAKILDDKIDVKKFFPLPGMMPGAEPQGQPTAQQPATPQRQLGPGPQPRPQGPPPQVSVSPPATQAAA